MSNYTLAVWYTKDGKRVREIVDPNWRMPFNCADQMAATLNRRHVPDRCYKAVNVKETENDNSNAG